MKRFWAAVLLLASVAFAAETKHPGQAGNDNIDLTATVLLDPSAVRQELGMDLEPGYVVVRVTAMPKVGDPMRIGPDDFVLLSRKNGERADAMAPEQITSRSALVVRRDRSGRDFAQQTNEPGFVGVAGLKKGESSANDAKLLAALKAKALPDKETKEQISGLIYFSFDASKLKTKDLALIYKGRGGRLTIEFK
jgi:hypothetical protein